MNNELGPYPAYKDSGVSWLGDVPEHWEVLKARYLFREIDQRSQTGAETHLSMSQTLGLVPSSMLEQRTLVSESYVGGKLCDEEDLVLNRLKAHLGVFALAKQPGVISPDYTVLRRTRPMVVKYFEQVLRSPACRHELRVRAKGIVEGFWRLYTDDFYDIRLPAPQADEQAAVVRFVDQIDRRVYRYIRAKQKLIKLLEEQEQAIVHRTITRGLDLNVALKPTGNPWFPKIPCNWNVLPLRRLIRRAVDGPHHSPQYFDDGLPFLSARNIKIDRWSLSDVKYISEADFSEFSKRIVPERGDVLYTKGGTTGVARAVDLDFRFQVWVHVAVLKLQRHKVNPTFLALALNSPRCYEQAQLYTKGATNQDLGLNRMKGIVLPAPPITEQEAIVEALEENLSKLRAARADIKRGISLIREYRTRIIADVVTGKLDVREAVATLPHEPEEPVALDEAEVLEGEEVGEVPLEAVEVEARA